MVEDDAEEEINHKMRGIMLGEETNEFAKKKRVSSIKNIHKKRKTKAWRKSKSNK